jgi:cell division protein FtsB
MNAEFNVWDQLTRIVIFLLFVAGLLGVAVWYMPLIHQNERYRKEILHLDAAIHKEEETAKQLHNEIEALRRDTNAVARLARERLSYGKPGETIIRFEAPVTNAIPRP